MVVQLYPHQQKAVNELSDGKVLVGGVGTGKTITSLVYFYTKVMGGELNKPETITNPMDLYIFTTARKRDELDWQRDAAKLAMTRDRDASIHHIQVTVDSYNNIAKYKEIKNAFVILDEQRMVGTGTWVKSFLKIAKSNRWIMLSATPGDKWEDYIPLFIANGFVKNITEFRRNHIVYAPYTKYPKVERYLQTGQLIRWRRELLVEMPYLRHTTRHIHRTVCDHDVEMMKTVMEKRWHPFEQRPLRDMGEMFAMMRKVAYSHESRKAAVIDLVKNKHPRLIVFYNFDYELETLRTLADDLPGWAVAEWNGHKHEPVPTGDKWLYLVQYVAGAEAWNCVETDAICFYSQTYSYRNYEQAQGRIDRLNTPHKDLHYYVLVSTSRIDKAISRALRNKKNFNETDFGVWKD
ncbi:DNA helicase [Gordonia phage Secretariat]|uniref:DNA helicase n=1 Tax=Gordonia phage Secretariat TaxID=2725616 RepID=A0A6M3T9R5_9CAUD|nr:DNA helicase [Gordonia phage Secretariat]QJD49654.1 DNA helicase [Gordonia phage Secretariat]